MTLQTRGQAGEMSKRIKAADSVAVDLQRRADEAAGELHTSRTEIQRLGAEWARARASCDDMQARLEAANRDNKHLAGMLMALTQLKTYLFRQSYPDIIL